MKRIILFIVLLMQSILFSTTFAVERENMLKVYNWADYIDQDVLNNFPAWYYEQTGETVEILYQTFDINESMLTEIEVGHEDYDVICPSEYIIERMLKQGLLLPIDKNYNNTPDYTQLVSKFVVDKFEQMRPDTNTTVSDYTVGYMWGTTGILYNTQYVNREDVISLGGLQDPKFEGKVFMKDAFRDVYSVVVLYVYRDEIARGEVSRDDLVANITHERIARVEKFLTSMKNNVAGWEVDFGKEEMTKGKAWLNLSWSGDAQWAIDEAAAVGVNLEYLVPQEGSNVWFDGWCIPKYAKNTKAASYFINYMCMPENAIKNMEEIGYVSVIASPEILEWANDSTIETVSNLTYFFGEGAEAVHANHVFYPDQSVIERCALMHDAGDMNEELINMWARVKGDNLNNGLIWFLGIVLASVIGIVIYRALNKRKETKPSKKQKRRK